MGKSIFGSVSKPGATGSSSLLGINQSDALGVFKPVTVIVYVNVPDPDFIFTDAINAALLSIQTNYLDYMAAKKYNLIANNINDILNIYDQVYTFQLTRKNANVISLLQIAMDSLSSSMNIYTIYTQNVELQLSNMVLTQKVETILAGKNETNVMSNATGQLSITRSFTLAPLFNYYIAMFGMPDFGVGFDPLKLAMINTVLEQNGINPYG